ncbi:hypothetical protein ACFQ0M_10770 [Kitasatospora aburaviensis]
MAPVAFADSVPAAKQSGAAVPPSLAATMAAADAKRAKDKPAVTAADKAIAQAKATKKPVPVPELTDEFSETVATPRGTSPALSTLTSSVPSSRTAPGPPWTPRSSPTRPAASGRATPLPASTSPVAAAGRSAP